jgi:hypothetical protein
MTVPIYITAGIVSVITAYASDRAGRRSPFILGFLLMMAVGFAMSDLLPVAVLKANVS